MKPYKAWTIASRIPFYQVRLYDGNFELAKKKYFWLYKNAVSYANANAEHNLYYWAVIGGSLS
jgi:hypothetical protein